MGGNPMFVSKDHDVQADLYMESEAEEIYLPESQMRKGYKQKNRRVSSTTEDDSGILGYQKYLHIVNRLAVDNTDAREPRQPELTQFLRISAAEEEADIAKRYAMYE